MQLQLDAQLKSALLAAARNVSARGDHRVVLPIDTARTELPRDRPLKIGLFGNLANQAYITARALRRLGHDVELVVQQNNIDAHVLSRPYWEEVERECVAAEDAIEAADAYKLPAFVRDVSFDADLQFQYQNRPEAVEDVIDLYKQSFGRTLPRDVALLLAQWMGHWPYIRAMGNYDVVHLSMWPICLGIFCPRPFVACPLGGDLYIAPFEEDVQGLMFRAGYHAAARIFVAETDYFDYLDRLETPKPRGLMPLVVDTDIYDRGVDLELRAAWQLETGGDRFILSVCRQSWQWKGSDRLIRAFARFCDSGGERWRLILQGWGDDFERSRDLVGELSLGGKVLWVKFCSKPTLRRRQMTADIVADQFVMEGYGASVLESMAAGKPVLIAPVPERSVHHFAGDTPPFVGAKTEEEIFDALKRLDDDGERARIGSLSRKWVERWHSYRTLSTKYLDSYSQVTVPADTNQPTTRAHEPGEPEELLAAFHRLHQLRRQELRSKWNRSLPIGDEMTDRWERARFLGFGNGSSIYDSALVIGDVKVGEKTWIGPQCLLDGSGGLEIGSTCSISTGCQIYSHDTIAWAVSGGTAPYRRESTRIGDAVYLGPGSIVAKGAVIGDHAIIGAMSLVHGGIPPFAFAAGIPARVLGRVILGDDGTVSIEREGSKKQLS